MSTMQNRSLLIIEDCDEDFEAFCRGWRKWNVEVPVYRCLNGDEALDFLNQEGKYSDSLTSPPLGMILLDLNLPGTDGREVLAQIKQNYKFHGIPVVIFTSSSNPKDLAACYQQGANSYIIKPLNVKKLMDSIRKLNEYWFETNCTPQDESDLGELDWKEF